MTVPPNAGRLADGEDELRETQSPIETDRMVLEPLVAAHAGQLFTQLRESALYTFIPSDPPRAVSDLEARYARLQSRKSPDGLQRWLNWAARRRSDAGYVGLFEVTIVPGGTALVAYFVFVAAQRQGLAREGLRAVIDVLARVYGVTLVQADIDARNAASLGLVKSLGFEPVAYTMNTDFFKGRASDEIRLQLRCGTP